MANESSSKSFSSSSKSSSGLSEGALNSIPICVLCLVLSPIQLHISLTSFLSIVGTPLSINRIRSFSDDDRDMQNDLVTGIVCSRVEALSNRVYPTLYFRSCLHSFISFLAIKEKLSTSIYQPKII